MAPGEILLARGPLGRQAHLAMDAGRLLLVVPGQLRRPLAIPAGDVVGWWGPGPPTSDEPVWRRLPHIPAVRTGGSQAMNVGLLFRVPIDAPPLTRAGRIALDGAGRGSGERWDGVLLAAASVADAAEAFASWGVEYLADPVAAARELHEVVQEQAAPQAPARHVLHAGHVRTWRRLILALLSVQALGSALASGRSLAWVAGGACVAAGVVWCGRAMIRLRAWMLHGRPRPILELTAEWLGVLAVLTGLHLALSHIGPSGPVPPLTLWMALGWLFSGAYILLSDPAPPAPPSP